MTRNDNNLSLESNQSRSNLTEPFEALSFRILDWSYSVTKELTKKKWYQVYSHNNFDCIFESLVFFVTYRIQTKLEEKFGDSTGRELSLLLIDCLSLHLDRAFQGHTTKSDFSLEYAKRVEEFEKFSRTRDEDGRSLELEEFCNKLFKEGSLKKEFANYYRCMILVSGSLEVLRVNELLGIIKEMNS